MMAAETGPGEQQYSLRWNDFHSAMLSSFRHLRDEEDFVDVTLACDGLSFSAHKVVLSACSPYFRKLLKANPCQHPIVILRDIHNKDMDSLLRFMYHGEVHIGQEQLPDFLKAAQLLQVRGLTDVPTHGAPAALSQPPLAPSAATAIEQKISPSSWVETGSAGSRESRPEGREERRSRRTELSNSSNTPPKRARSSDLYHAQMKSRTEQLLAQEQSPERLGNNSHDLRETLLSQALESAQNTHLSNMSNNMSGDGDESSSDAALSDNECDLPRNNVPKQEPLDYGEDSNMICANGGILDPARTPNFPGALLNLQGLLPGPSGMHGAADNFGPHWTGAGDHLTNQSMHKNGETRHHPNMPPAMDFSTKLEDFRNYQSNGAALMGGGAAVSYRPQCPLCGRVYSSTSNLRQHMLNVHSQTDRDQWYPCQHCGKKCKTKHYLINHQLQAHGIRQRQNS